MNSKLSVIIAAVLAGGGMVTAGALAVLHVDRDTIFLIASFTIVPALTAVLSGQIGEAKGQIGQVASNTNGNTSALIALAREQSRMLAASGPASAPPASPIEEPQSAPDAVAVPKGEVTP